MQLGSPTWRSTKPMGHLNFSALLSAFQVQKAVEYLPHLQYLFYHAEMLRAQILFLSHAQTVGMIMGIVIIHGTTEQDKFF